MLTRVNQNLTISCAENNISQDQINKLNMTMNLWTEFISIYKKLKSGLNKNDSEEIKHRTREWLRLFFNLYHDTHETPYIHFFFICMSSIKFMVILINSIKRDTKSLTTP